MRIIQEKSTIKTAESSLFPELVFSIKIEIEDEKELLIYQGGTLIANNIRIGEVKLGPGQNSHVRNFLFSHNSNFYQNDIRGKNRIHTEEVYIFSSVLNPQAVDYLEDLRNSNKKKDMHLSVQLTFQCLKSTEEMSNIINHHEHPSLGKPGTMVNRMEIFHSIIVDGTCEFIISQSRWIQDFAERLGIGKFLLLELKLPPRKPVNADWEEQMNRALKNTAKVEALLQEGKWYEAIETSRKISELFKFKVKDGKSEMDIKNKELLRQLFVNVNHSEKGFDDLCHLISKLFDFISKFEHEKDQQGNWLPEPIPQKEDAYFVYAICVALVNMISSKIA